MPRDVDLVPLPRSLHATSDGPVRTWSPVGTIDDGTLAEVDGAGLVRLRAASWSLDWWIGAEDRWHHPSVEAAVRQQSLGGTPVRETAVRVPGGDVVQRAFGVRARVDRSDGSTWRGPAVVVEVENRTAVPVALALVVRPLVLDGAGRVVRASVDGPVVSVDGRGAVLLSRPPARVVAGRAASGPASVASRLADGDDRPPPVGIEDRDGLAELATVTPLAHTAVVRVLLLPSDTGWSGGAAGWEAPEVEAVVAGWQRHREAAPSVSLPEPSWAEALAWSDRMLVLSGPDEVGSCLDRRRVRPAGPPAAVRAAEVAEVLVRLGASESLEPVARALAAAQRLGGEVRLGDRSDGTVALVHAAAGVLTGPRAQARAEELVAPVAVAVRRIRKGKGAADDLAPSAVRALRSVAPALVSVGQPEVAADALAAAVALGGAEAPRAGRADDGSGLGQALVARDAVAGGSEDAVARVRSLWEGRDDQGRSDAERAVDGGGHRPCGVLGFDVAELAARTSAMLDLVVRDGDGGPGLLAACPESWRGAGVEAHRVRTPWGEVSYAVRWHGGRPALLWEVDRADGLLAEPVPTVAAPGLDPSWSGIGWSGEALLGGSSSTIDDDQGSWTSDPGQSFS